MTRKNETKLQLFPRLHLWFSAIRVYICVAHSVWIVEDPYCNIIRVVAAVIRRVQKEKLPKIELTIFFLCILQELT